MLKEGDVTRAEFFLEAESPLAPTSVIGHQAWYNDPSYLKIEVGKSVRVENEAGRVHTFTEVANFGAGRVRPPATAVQGPHYRAGVPDVDRYTSGRKHRADRP